MAAIAEVLDAWGRRWDSGARFGGWQARGEVLAARVSLGQTVRAEAVRVRCFRRLSWAGRLRAAVAVHLPSATSSMRLRSPILRRRLSGANVRDERNVAADG